MSKRLLGRWSIIHIVIQKVFNECLTFFRDIIPIFFWKINFSTSYHSKYIFIRAKKRRSSREKHKGNDPNRPYIAFLIVFFIKNFRCNVVRCSNLFIDKLFFVNIKKLSTAEINNFDSISISSLFQKDVLRFKISMDNSLVMQVSYCCEQSFDKKTGLLLTKATKLRISYSIKQFTS